MKQSEDVSCKNATFLQKVLEWCAKIEVKLMSKVLGRLWGHLGRLRESLSEPKSNFGFPKGQK